MEKKRVSTPTNTNSIPLSTQQVKPTVEKTNWNIIKNPPSANKDDTKQYEEAISIDLTMSDKSTQRHDLGKAYGCTGSTIESIVDDSKIFGSVTCYFALSGAGFTAYSENGKFIVERGDESAKDGSVKKTVLLEI